MDIDAYVQDVKDRLSAVTERREKTRAAALGPVAPLQREKQEITDRLNGVVAGLRAETDVALQQLKTAAAQRRLDASDEAARIRQAADLQAKEVLRQARAQSAEQRASVVKDHDDRLQRDTQELREALAGVEQRETAALHGLADELANADGEYVREYERIVAERIITRKALSGMGFRPPSRRKQHADTGGR